MSKTEVFDSKTYWEERYASGGNSGGGSYGKLAKFKVDVLNAIVEKYKLKSVIDFGCGDGNNIRDLVVDHYVGLDVSVSAVKICKQKYKDVNDGRKRLFLTMDDAPPMRADMTMSLDVLYHIIDEREYESYLRQLFESSTRYVVIYSSNFLDPVGNRATHVHHRVFTDDVDRLFQDFQLVCVVKHEWPTVSSASFYLYKKK